MLVKNLMTKNPRSCSPSEALNAAAHVMWEADCGSIPIVDEERHVVGFLTDRDICMAAYTQGRLLSEIPIHAAMSNAVLSCRADDTVDAAETQMRDARVRRLPVVNEERQLVGILSLNDLAREAAHPGHGHTTDAPQPADLAQTLAEICTPRWAASAPPA